MSQKGINVHPVRQRAGYLSALSKLYKTVQRLVDMQGSIEDAIELQGKLHDRYTKYLASHENALASVPEREASLNASHVDIEKRHREAADLLQAYIDDGEKTERSMHVRSLFSSTSSIAETARSASTKHSSRRSSRSNMSNSDRLSEARVQAELAKANIAQQRALLETLKKKRAVERDAARHLLEFEQQAAQRKSEMEQEAARRQFEIDEQRREAARKQFELDEQKRIRDEELKQKDIQRRQLQEEIEREEQELEEAIETQRQIDKYERLRDEIKIREREELRLTLGSDYESSDDECDDITQPNKTVTKILGFQSINDQQANMRKILESCSKPLNTKEVTPQRAVTNWLQETDTLVSRKLKVPKNTPAEPRQGYAPHVETRRDEVCAQPKLLLYQTYRKLLRPPRKHS